MFPDFRNPHGERRDGRMRGRHADVYQEQQHRGERQGGDECRYAESAPRRWPLSALHPQRLVATIRAMMWPGTFDNINDGSRDRAGLFGEWESHLDRQWLTLLGVRYERVTTDAGNVRGYDPTTNGMGMMVNDQKKGRRRVQFAKSRARRQQLGPDSACPLYAGCQQRHRIRRRAQGAFAQPV
jgi:hypothetical protein